MIDPLMQPLLAASGEKWGLPPGSNGGGKRISRGTLFEHDPLKIGDDFGQYRVYLQKHSDMVNEIDQGSDAARRPPGLSTPTPTARIRARWGVPFPRAA